MPEVTVFTAARSQQIEDTSIVSGRIEGSNGHLMLIKNNGSEVDAGAISFFQATDIAAGSVELATSDEVRAGTDTQRAVTPAALASLPGVRYSTRIVYTSSGTFNKASYPDMKALRVRLVGGGGGGGAGRPAGTGNHSSGGGGGGAGYAEKWITAASLAATETVTVGAGGTGTSTQGTAGGTTTFGSHCGAGGGGGGNTASDQTLLVPALGGASGVGISGDIMIGGSAGNMGFGYATLGIPGEGGSSMFGGGGAANGGPGGAAASQGYPGLGYGAGGGGSAQNAGAAGTTIGAAGSPGIVIVEVFV
ncbi:hypothetical protein SEA_LEWANDO_26 [Arthrobacter phage Lewando]|nr:hypothetical protein SEA_LEWANDO_26 [Arthrobacter phage Lewando]